MRITFWKNRSVFFKDVGFDKLKTYNEATYEQNAAVTSWYLPTTSPSTTVTNVSASAMLSPLY